MRQITDLVVQFPMFFGFVNAYAIRDGNQFVIVDTGVNARAGDAIVSDLTSAGHTMTDIKAIFITHGHIDHAGGLARLQKLVDVPTYVHAKDAPIVRGEAKPDVPKASTVGFPARLMLPMVRRAGFAPARVDKEVAEGDTILDGWTVVHLPGHTWGQSGLWHAESRTLIGGDVMTNFNGIGTPPAPATPDMNLARDSIRKVAELDVDTLCLGHGKPITDAAPKINKLVAKFGTPKPQITSTEPETESDASENNPATPSA